MHGLLDKLLRFILTSDLIDHKIFWKIGYMVLKRTRVAAGDFLGRYRVLFVSEVTRCGIAQSHNIVMPTINYGAKTLNCPSRF